MHDESIEVIEAERKSESPPRFLPAFRGNLARTPSGIFSDSGSHELDIGLRMSNMEDQDTRDGFRDEVTGPRQQSSIGELKRPVTAGRPGTAGTRPGTAGTGARPVSTRPRPPSPEPSEVGGVSEDDDDEYDEGNSAQLEGPLAGCTPSEFEFDAGNYNYNESGTEDECSEFDEYFLDASNLTGISPNDDLADLLDAIPEDPEFFLPPMSNSNYPEEEDVENDLAKKRWKEIILEKKRDLVRQEVLYSCNPGVHRAGYRVYNPADYEGLNTTEDIKELFEYITKYSANATNSRVDVKLRPFIPEYYPSVGDIDAFIKVIHDDVKKDGLGIKVLDEPSAFQSDPSVLDLRLRALAKQNSAKAVVVKKVENVGKNAKIIENWIKDISDLHHSKPSPSVHYSKPMPDIDSLLQEWPPEFEELLKNITLPSSNMECDLKTYVDLICNLLDIPVYKSRIQSLHLLATLYSTHKSFHSFGLLGNAGNDSGMPPSTASSRRVDQVDRLELS